MKKTNNTTMLLSSAGALAGLYFAFKNKNSFLGYVGYFVLGGVAGHLAGNIVSAVIPNPKNLSDNDKGEKSDSNTQSEKIDETSKFVGEATLRQIGSAPCNSSDNFRCKQACFKLGGRFNSSDRQCYDRNIGVSVSNLRKPNLNLISSNQQSGRAVLTNPNLNSVSLRK